MIRLNRKQWWLYSLIVFVLATSILLSSCGAQATATPAPSPATAAPVATEAPVATAAQGVTEVPTATQAPAATTAPSATQAPGATPTAAATQATGAASQLSWWSGKRYDGVKLKVAMEDEVREHAVQKQLADFKATTGIDVTIDFYAFDQLYQKNLAAGYAHTHEYDIMQLHFPDMALFDGRGYMADISDLVERDKAKWDLADIPETLQDSHMKFNGKWYGVPMHIGAMAFYYRTDIFNQMGLQAPKTWDEVIQDAKAISAKYAPQTNGVALMVARDIQGAATYLSFLGANGVYLYDQNFKPTMDTPGALKAMQQLKELSKYAGEGSSAYSLSEAQAAFAQGKAAMAPMWDVVASAFDDPSNSNVIGKWAVTYMPGGSETNGGWSVQIAADSPNREAAWEFLKWVVSKELDHKLAGSYCSARLSSLKDPAVDGKYPGCQVFRSAIEAGVNLVPFPKIEPDYEVLDYVALAVSEVIVDLKTPEAALKDLQGNLEKLMQVYGLGKK